MQAEPNILEEFVQLKWDNSIMILLHLLNLQSFHFQLKLPASDLVPHHF